MSLRKRIDNTLRKFEKAFETQNLIEVSKSALIGNLHLFNELSGKAIIPVLKGNAYGHGIEQVAIALKNEKIPYIGVDGYFEALRIRDVSRKPVLIMGAIMPKNFKHIHYDNFTFVIQDGATVHALGATGRKQKVHLECNTGMNRYGASYENIEELTRLILSYKNLELEGVMSHLADSDGDNIETVDAAVERFDEAVDKVLACGATPNIFHVAQSAGSLKAKSKYANTIRLGIGLYGINPFPAEHNLYAGLASKLRPAMRLISTVSKITDLKQGDQVSYNYTFTAPKGMRVGVLPLGYYEGVNRSLSNRGVVKINGKFQPIVGRVCMNHTIIELVNDKTNVGDKVVVYSNQSNDQNSVDSIAKIQKLFSYNLLTSLSSDIRRILVD
ncbi:MAG: alanine racemase [Candidatus Saccharibacteria bacterium]